MSRFVSTGTTPDPVMVATLLVPPVRQALGPVLYSDSSFNAHDDPVPDRLSFCTRRNGDSETLSNLPRATQLVGRRVRI